tara:strand:+ start:63472 stop:64662 length:1191 start_codon:yes stop_codon:yes gene_type:complete
MNMKTLGAIFLISGTSIGAGMLALSVVTAAYGFMWATVLFVATWAYLTYTAFLILETTLWLPKETNMISMAKLTLGKPGLAVAWFSYLLLMYSLLAAYMTGLGGLTVAVINQYCHTVLPVWFGALIFIGVFGFVIYLGVKFVDGLNRIFVIGLIITYVTLLFILAPHVAIEHLKYQAVSHLWLAVPVVVTSFGFHVVIPGLRSYLNSDVKQLRLAIFVGSTVPLLVYILWELIVIGVIPLHGANGLMAIGKTGQPQIYLAQAFASMTHTLWIGKGFTWFAFFAMGTSLLGVAFSLFDFLADGFDIEKTHFGKLATALITFIPPFVFAIFYPKGFIMALSYAGIWIAVLLGALPACMVWWGRYRKQIAFGYQTIGGKIALVLVMVLSILVVIAQLAA